MIVEARDLQVGDAVLMPTLAGERYVPVVALTKTATGVTWHGWVEGTHFDWGSTVALSKPFVVNR